MFIQRVNEGEKLQYGLNLLSNEMTLISFKFCIPFWLFYSKDYFDFDDCSLCTGFRVGIIYFSFRIRRLENFSKKVKRFIFHYSFGSRPIGKQEITLSPKEIKDYIVPAGY